MDILIAKTVFLTIENNNNYEYSRHYSNIIISLTRYIPLLEI